MPSSRRSSTTARWPERSRRSSIWPSVAAKVFVVCSMTAILVSTSIQLIRSRIRMERVRADLLTRELDLPFGVGVDHAEGIGLLDDDPDGPQLLVVYDSPAPERLHEHGVTADVVRLPAPATAG